MDPHPRVNLAPYRMAVQTPGFSPWRPNRSSVLPNLRLEIVLISCALERGTGARAPDEVSEGEVTPTP